MNPSKATFVFLVVGCVFFLGCSDDDSEGPSTPIDTDTTEDAGIDSGGDTDTNVINEEEEMPTDLASSCVANVVQEAASEDDDWVSPGDGDGRRPDIDADESALMVWSHRAPDAGSVWTIQAAAYDPGPEKGDGGTSEVDAGTRAIGTVENPATSDVVSMDPALAARGKEFGIVWRDGRWDSTCDGSDVDECRKDLAFIRVDSRGQPIDSSNPIQVTYESVVVARPAIVATTAGYIVAWFEQADQEDILMAMHLDEAGSPGTPHRISTEEEGAYIKSLPGLAAIGDKAVVVWATPKQRTILARTLNGSAEPQGETQLVAKGNLCLPPRVAAGNEGFMVSWSMQPESDIEVFTRKLDGNGSVIGEPHQVTWTKTDVTRSDIAWSGSSFALSWLSSKANGEDDCIVKTCDEQVLAAMLDSVGKVSTDSVALSNDLNEASQLVLAWDGSGWTAVYELSRLNRQQAFYGRMTCN